MSDDWDFDFDYDYPDDDSPRPRPRLTPRLIRLKIHEYFERVCSRYVGRCWTKKYHGPSPLWFRAASKIEWWLRPARWKRPMRRERSGG